MSKLLFPTRDEVVQRIEDRRMSGTDENLKELETRVRCILISAGRPYRVSDIEKDYKILFGKRFPIFEIGLSHAIEVLRKIPEACEIRDSSGNDPLVYVKSTNKTVHIHKMVQKNKLTPKSLPTDIKLSKDVFVPFTVQDGIRCMLWSKGRMRKDEFYKMLEEKFDLEYMGLDISVDTLIYSMPHLVFNDGAYVKKAYNIEKSELEIPKYLHFEGEHTVPSYRLSKLEIEVAQHIATLLNEKQQMPIMEMPSLYKQRFGKSMNWEQLGFDHLWKFLLLIPGSFQLVKVNGNYFVAASGIDMPGTVDMREINAEKVCGDSVYQLVQEKIFHLVLAVTRGLNAKHLLSAYEEQYCEKLVIRTDFKEFLTQLKDSNIFRIQDGREIVLLPSDSSKVEIKLSNQQETARQIETVDILKPGDSLKYVDFQNNININNKMFCAACVSYSVSPSDFYIRLIGLGEDHEEQLGKEFKRLYNEMQEEYSNYYDDIALCNLRIGMICAVCVKGEWRRAIVLDATDKLISVRTVDDGERHEVTLSNLNYLKKKFAYLPVLAYKAKLFNIQPTATDWTIEAILKFKELTWDWCKHEPLPLSVLIAHRDAEGVFQVVLTSMQPKEEVHVGDVLLDLGHATFKITNKKIRAIYF